MALPNLRRHHPRERLSHLSPGDRERALAHPISGDLVVIYGGCFPEAKGHCIDRPRGYDSHQIALVEKGRGEIQVGRRILPISAGHLFVARGDGPVFYRTDDGDPWTLLWVHVTGRAALDLIQGAGFTPGLPVRKLTATEATTARRELTHALCMVESGGTLPGVLSGAEAMRRLFLMLAGAGRGDGKDPFPARCLAALGPDLRVSVTIPEWARRMGLSPTAFRLKVRAECGESPLAFLDRRRMEIARDLLRFTGISVAEAGEAVGFDDPFHFSRRYRRFFGHSPRGDRGSHAP